MTERIGKSPQDFLRWFESISNLKWLCGVAATLQTLNLIVTGSNPVRATKDPTINGKYLSVMVCEPDLKSSRLWGRIHKSEIHIAPYKRCSLTRRSSVGYVGNFKLRVPHYGLRGLGTLGSRNRIHKL